MPKNSPGAESVYKTLMRRIVLDGAIFPNLMFKDTVHN